MIRTAKHNEVPMLAGLAQAMAAESPEWRGMAFNIDKVARLLSTLIDSPRGFVRVYEHNGVPVGGLMAAATEHWGCDCLVAFELGLYVAPGARGQAAGVQLIEAYKQWVRDIGAKRGTAGVTTGLQTEQTAALYERAGGRRLGVIFDMTGGTDVHGL